MAFFSTKHGLGIVFSRHDGFESDEPISNNGETWDDSWNPIWYVKTQIDGLG
ncbi:hypothetical protein [Spongiimicrobium sp. 3-5]|uniref:hypothetical protein n=1 Tax=Spongiimicrobium sp. 3-5 TaxID=3332596 RepID=UPI00398187BA